MASSLGVSISPTFYKQLFRMKVICAPSQFVFVIFWRKEIGKKNARKLLVKLTLIRLRSNELDG